MGKILVGTSSWTDKSLIESGRFYPREIKTPEARLKYYASQFPLVEVDSSYYAIPSEDTATQWVERTPPDFVFDVKAFRLLTTHQTQPKVLPKHVRESLDAGTKNVYYKNLPGELVDAVWSEFRATLRPLNEAGKLGVILFQFPPWFTPKPENLAHLEECAARMQGYMLAVEFRNATWFGERGTRKTLDMLHDLNAAHVVVDEPQGFASSIPHVWEVTAPIAVLRLHGKNRETWNKKELKAASERFDYDYPENELQELVEPIEQLAKKAKTTHVLFNVNRADQGQRAAKTMRELLDV